MILSEKYLVQNAKTILIIVFKTSKLIVLIEIYYDLRKYAFIDM
jgi:hypothetical protein